MDKWNNFSSIGTDNFRVSVANGNIQITCKEGFAPVVKRAKDNKYLIEVVKIDK